MYIIGLWIAVGWFCIEIGIWSWCVYFDGCFEWVFDYFEGVCSLWIIVCEIDWNIEFGVLDKVIGNW